MRQHNVKPPSILLVEEVAANASKYVWFRPRLNSPAAITRPSAIIAPEIAIRDHKSKIKTGEKKSRMENNTDDLQQHCRHDW
jgi:hypothetical protein